MSTTHNKMFLLVFALLMLGSLCTYVYATPPSYIKTPFTTCRNIGFQENVLTRLATDDQQNMTYFSEIASLGEDCCTLTVDEKGCYEHFNATRKKEADEKMKSAIILISYSTSVILSILYLIFGRRIVKNDIIHKIFSVLSKIIVATLIIFFVTTLLLIVSFFSGFLVPIIWLILVLASIIHIKDGKKIVRNETIYNILRVISLIVLIISAIFAIFLWVILARNNFSVGTY